MRAEQFLRDRVLRPVDAPTPPGAHDTRSAVATGRLLGIVVLVTFVTGMISHLHQNPVGLLEMPSRPVWAYQVSQGLHVAAGIAGVPLLLIKLWVVYPRLFVWPPVRSAVHGLERALIVPLVAGMIFQSVTGLANISRWYPFPFFFPRTHYAVAWLVMGSLLAHLAFKARHLRPSWSSRRPQADDPPTGVDGEPDADRRALLAGALGSVAVLTAATAGQTLPLLRAVSVLAPRDVSRGAQGLAVNRTAAEGAVGSAALDPGWTLMVDGARPARFTLADLSAMPQVSARLPMACVEGWSFTAEWTGVPLRALLEVAGVRPDHHLRAVSLEQDWLYASSPLNPAQAWDPLTLLALRVNGERLHLDHGYPVRLIGPNRPGVQQTKWLSRIEPS